MLIFIFKTKKKYIYIYVFQNNKKIEILEDKRKENIKKYDTFVQKFNKLQEKSSELHHYSLSTSQLG